MIDRISGWGTLSVIILLAAAPSASQAAAWKMIAVGDSRGSDKYNKRLSTKRARAVMKHLIRKGKISKKRMKSKGFGEEKPIDTNLTDEGRAANRRVEFVRTDVPPPAE